MSATTFPSAPSAPVTIRTLPCIVVSPGVAALGLQIARLERRLLCCAEVEAVAQVGFEIAILAGDGLESGRQIRGLDGTYRVENVDRQIRRARCVAPIMRVGQQIVLRDNRIRDAERMQDQRACKAGAILAGRAMDDERRTVFQEMAEQGAKR